jgi:hypothetical protein
MTMKKQVEKRLIFDVLVEASNRQEAILQASRFIDTLKRSGIQITRYECRCRAVSYKDRWFANFDLTIKK